MTEWTEVETEEGADPATRRVPSAWHEYNQQVKQVYHEFVETYEDVPDVTGLAVTKGETVIDGRRASKPVVHVEDEFATDIPDEIDGIPIGIRPPQGDWCSTDVYTGSYTIARQRGSSIRT